MGEYFTNLFDTSDFPQRWQCGNWSDFLGWLHILSDVATFAAYMAIPIVLVYFVRKRNDIPFTRLFLLFACFIMACGTVHLFEAIAFWLPLYRVSGLLKFFTAVISWATVIALIRVVPKVMHLPSLAAAHIQLADREQQLSSLISSTAEGIYGIDLEGNCTFANDACAKLLGYDSPEALAGKQMHELIHHTRRDGTPYPNDECRIYRAFRQSERVHVDDEVYWRRDGTSFEAEYWSYPQVRDGETVGCVVTFLDVTERKTSDRAILEEQARLDLALRAGHMGSWQWDAVADRVELSDQLFELFGIPREHPITDRAGFLEIIHPEDRQRVESRLSAVFRGRCAEYEMEFRIIRGDDQRVIWTYGRGAIDRDDQGKPLRITAVANDISQRKRWEHELADREAHLRRVIDNTLYFISVLSVDGTLLEANATAINAGGIRREDVIGQKFWDCYWWSFSDESVERLQQAIQLGATGEIVRDDVTARMAGDARMTVDFMICPVRDDDGQITHLISSGVDISDRVIAEKARRENEERLSMALRAGGMAAWEWTPRESVWTEALYDLMGIPHDQTASPELLFAHVHPDDVVELKQAWQLAIEGKAPYDHEFRIVRPDGQTRWVAAQGEVVRDGQGAIVRAFGLNWDSTEVHQAAAALRESERKAQQASISKSEFVANMSHEIRTPMTAVLGYADLLAAREDDPEKLEYLGTIKRNGTFLLDIINDILDLSKIEAGKFEILRERFAPHQVIADVRSMMDVRAREKGLALEITYQGNMPATIESDPKRMKQILVNLLGNAIKFTESGTVRLVVRLLTNHQPKLQFDVFDTGIGMHAEQLSRLFQPFSQGDATITRSFGGTGLGLAISHRLVSMLGGEISVSSEHGQGSKFSFSIEVGDLSGVPFVDPMPVVPDDSPAAAKLEQKLDCHVLLVDDRRDVRFLAKRFLNRAGASVTEANDGQEAVELVERLVAEHVTFDLILLDMQMPRLDGYQTAARLRAMGVRQPIIALTADAMHGDMKRCLEAGCDAYLSKPIDANALLDMAVTYTQEISQDELDQRRDRLS